MYNNKMRVGEEGRVAQVLVDQFQKMECGVQPLHRAAAAGRISQDKWE